MRTIMTQWNYHSKPGEVNTLPSCTQPDMSLSIKEIIHRFMITGVLPEEVAQYDAEYDTDDVEYFDVPSSSYAADIAEVWQEHETAQAQKAIVTKRTKRSEGKSSEDSSAGVTADQSSETKSSENHSE